jgi:hypothetical protein
MQALKLSRQAGLVGSAPPRQSKQRLRVVAKASEVPPNVQEAREWIAAWRAKQGKSKPSEAPAAPSGNGKLAPVKSFKDGTLLFTADSLAAVKYDDIKLKGK